MQWLFCSTVDGIRKKRKKKKRKKKKKKKEEEETEIYGEKDTRVITDKIDNKFLKSQTMKYCTFYVEIICV